MSLRVNEARPQNRSSIKDRTLDAVREPVSSPMRGTQRAISVDSPVVSTVKPAAVLWDMDGTIIDSEPYWMRAETVLMAKFGREWTHELGLTMVGQGLSHSAGILQSNGVDMPTNDIIDFLSTMVMEQIASSIPWRPGARELLEDVSRNGVPNALVTMSFRQMADLVVSTVGFDAFSAVVSGDEVSQPKPHPEAYRRAAELLGVAIVDCVAIEDSVPGLTSAMASGAVSIGVPHVTDLPDIAGYTLWPTLADRTARDISAVFEGARS
jgi:HAD superfamily hydrolase (TIGR01509 family)